MTCSLCVVAAFDGDSTWSCLDAIERFKLEFTAPPPEEGMDEFKNGDISAEESSAGDEGMLVSKGALCLDPVMRFFVRFLGASLECCCAEDDDMLGSASGSSSSSNSSSCKWDCC